MQPLYCLSGLGADHRVFQNIVIDGFELVHIPWQHFGDSDTVSTYAKKMSALIPGNDPYILGVSFGGMLAVEIAKFRPVTKAFIISSAKTVSELTPPNWLVRLFIQTNIFPVRLLKTPIPFVFKLFGARTKSEMEMMRGILHDSDPYFMRQVMRALMKWDSTSYTDNIVHIHGTADKIIPPGPVKPHHWIKDGSHIMIYNRATEINALIGQYL